MLSDVAQRRCIVEPLGLNAVNVVQALVSRDLQDVVNVHSVVAGLDQRVEDNDAF